MSAESRETRRKGFGNIESRQQLPLIRLSPGAKPRLMFRSQGSPVLTQSTSQQDSQAFRATESHFPMESEDSGTTDTDDDGHLIKRALRAKDDLLKMEAEKKQHRFKRRKINTARSPGVTLKTLVDEQLITAGNNVLTLEYRGKTETANIDSEGRIEWNGTKFDSPSSFSIHVKRGVNPSRKADDGWKTVKYKGRYLEFYKLELAKRRCSSDRHPTSESSTSGADTQTGRTSTPDPETSVARQSNLVINTSRELPKGPMARSPDSSLPPAASARMPFFCST